MAVYQVYIYIAYVDFPYVSDYFYIYMLLYII